MVAVVVVALVRALGLKFGTSVEESVLIMNFCDTKKEV